MGVTREKAAENREAIIAAAEELFRDRGVDAVGLVELMKAAGLTRGGFYNHFTSKGALVDEVVTRAMTRGLADLDCAAAASAQQGTDPLTDQFDYYLSPDHRADIAHGCPNAGFAGDARRFDPAAMCDYAKGLAANIERLEQIVRDATRIEEPQRVRALTLATFSQMVGALLLSRAVAESAPGLSDEILDAARGDLRRRIA
ncbi:TetR/AcrR family transcriptional regulator [Streptomyces sp. GESEQ-35]|uniref:TetR/AcrR family transcriptional regulator n=1 Tax=Streptomyces sp. GESEQ-35 TaxID=2812657 RepID=UPI001B33986B|nr:TetR/AcrR family transcriptional regulator [Streptomyces sp. GESEQ-35]